jgi:4-amino-4-deoxy-L-arabinose transferase-like glycosyltransferase
VYFVALGASSIWDANEAFYVDTPREMLEAHDFVNPSFNYLPRFNKPVLSYWIVAGFYKVFGVSVGVQRLPIALGAMIIIGCAFRLARLAGGVDSGSAIRDPRLGIRDQGLGMRDSGLWAAAGLAASPRLVMFARRIFIDIWISAFMALTLTFFALSERYPERRRRYLLLMYVSVGLGALTKGPVAFVLPGLAFALYLAVRGELRRTADMMLPLGVLIIAAIVVPWYAALYHQHGWTYIKSFVVSENVERFTAGVGVRQHRGPWFYLPVVLSDSFPWSPLLIPAAMMLWRSHRKGLTHSVETLLWCWIAAIVGFFSLSAGKQDLYIFPIVPAVAALGGLAIARAAGDEGRTRVAVTLAVSGALLALAGAGVIYLFETAGRVYALEGAMAVGAFGVAGGVVALAFGALRRPAAAALALLASMVAVNWTFVTVVLPDFERYKPVPAMSALLAQRLQPGDVVAHYQVALPSMVYYLRRHVDQYFDEEPFVQAVLSPARVYAVLSDNDYAALAPRIARRTCIIGRQPTFDIKLKNVLAREPLPELVLITNQCR